MKRFLVAAIAVGLSTSIFANSQSDKQKKTFKVGSTICGLEKGVYVPGTLKGKRFTSTAKNIRDLKKQISITKGSAKRKNRAKLVKLFSALQNDQVICGPGPDAIRIDLNNSVAFIRERTTEETSDPSLGSSNIAKIDAGGQITEALLSGFVSISGGIQSYGSQLFLANSLGFFTLPEKTLCYVAVATKGSLYPRCIEQAVPGGLTFSNLSVVDSSSTKGFYYWMKPNEKEPDVGSLPRTLRYFDGTTSKTVFADDEVRRSFSTKFVVGSSPTHLYINTYNLAARKGEIVEYKDGVFLRLLTDIAGSTLYTFGDGKLYTEAYVDSPLSVWQVTPGETVTLASWTGRPAQNPLGGTCNQFPVEEDGNNYCGIYPKNLYLYGGAAYASTGSENTVVYKLYPTVAPIPTSVERTSSTAGIAEYLFISGRDVTKSTVGVVFNLNTQTEVPVTGIDAHYFLKFTTINNIFGVIGMSYFKDPSATAEDFPVIKLWRVGLDGKASLLRDYGKSAIYDIAPIG